MPRGYVCKQRFGVALFDDEVSASSGWACIHNDTPFYFLSSEELPKDVIWLSNLSRLLIRDQGIRALQHIKPEDFLFTPVPKLINELGLCRESPRHQSSYLVNIFFNVMNHLYLQTGVYGVKHDALNTEIRNVSAPEEYPVWTAATEAATDIVGNRSVGYCSSKDENEERDSITLLFHRYEYARDLLAGNMPFGRWTTVSSSVIDSGQQFITEWVRTSSRPLFIKVKACFKDLVAERLFLKSRSPLDVYWVTLDEYSWLSKYAELDVVDALVCEGYGPSPVSLPELGRIASNSFSFGLYCESIWTSLTKTISGNLSKAPIAAWLIGYDRVMCLDKAYKIEKHTRCKVNALGFGRIMLTGLAGSRSQMPNIAFQHGLIAPMSVGKETFHRTLPDTTSPSQLMQVVMERGASGFIQQTDLRALDVAVDLYDQRVYERAPYTTIAL